MLAPSGATRLHPQGKGGPARGMVQQGYYFDGLTSWNVPVTWNTIMFIIITFEYKFII